MWDFVNDPQKITLKYFANVKEVWYAKSNINTLINYIPLP